MSEEISAGALPLPEAIYESPKGDCRIAFRPAGHILLVLGRPFGDDLSARLALLSDGVGAVRAAGPGAWYLVGDTLPAPNQIEQMETQLGGAAAIVDQSHGRVRLEISGSGATWKLAKGTAVDLSINRFPIGAACETLFGHISIHLTRLGENSFEALVGRSFALSLWEELTH